jgi:hypothetical protein
MISLAILDIFNYFRKKALRARFSPLTDNHFSSKEIEIYFYIGLLILKRQKLDEKVMDRTRKIPFIKKC